MDSISIIFIIMSVFVIGYLLISFRSEKRTHLGIEILFVGIYGLVLLLFLFPQVLRTIERTLGIVSAINFFVYLSIFVAYLLLFMLYTKSEKQRQELTELTRKIALKKK